MTTPFRIPALADIIPIRTPVLTPQDRVGMICRGLDICPLETLASDAETVEYLVERGCSFVGLPADFSLDEVIDETRASRFTELLEDDVSDDEIVEAMVEAYDNVYEAELRLGKTHWEDNKPQAMRAALAIAKPMIAREARRQAIKDASAVADKYGEPAIGGKILALLDHPHD